MFNLKIIKFKKFQDRAIFCLQIFFILRVIQA